MKTFTGGEGQTERSSMGSTVLHRNDLAILNSCAWG